MVDLTIDVIKATTQFVAAQAWEEISLARGFQGHLKNLKEKFNDTQAFLKDVGSANDVVKRERVKRWLQKVKDVTYFADNVMNDYDYEILRREIELGKNLTRKKKVCNLFSPSNNPIVFRFRMTHKVLEIISKFDELDKEAKKIGLIQRDLDKEGLFSVSTSYDERTHLEHIRNNPSAELIVGREADKQKLVEMMCSHDNDKEHLSTIVIVGLGGLGKTTLARALYHDKEKVAKHFDKKMWICVSEDFNVEKILKEMVEMISLKKWDLELTTMDILIEELQKHLKDKKFLLVLDDVWTEDTALWELLKGQLKRIKGREGSVILVTTRNEKVATSAGVGKPYKLEGLSDKDSWSLFEKWVTIPSSHKDVGHKIVKKCKGIPLAITTMGGLLQSKKSLSDWEAMEKEEVWDTFLESSPNYILPSLFLSYQHLPSLSLKQCFAYCATFPKDHIMEKNALIDLWIAQGFLTIHGTSNSTSKMEKMGEDCFKALLNISFLQLEEGHWTEHNTEKEIWKCKMHDLVHDLAIHIFEKELFIWDAKADTSFTVFNCRHLVLFDFTEDKSKPLKEEIIQQVRTMNIWSGKCPSWNVLTEARCLRTLIIVNKGITEVPPTIGKLKHLRYLDLSSNPIEILPHSICKLYQLQALILWETRLKELPKELCKLINLRRLTISDCVCQHLPINDLGRLPNLRGLCLCKMPEVETVGEEVNGNETENNHVNESLDTTNKGKYIDGSSIENEFFPVLRELRIRGFTRLRKLNLLPPAIATTVAVPFPCLELLEIVECPRLEVVETSPALSFESLKSLFLYDNIESEEPLNIIKYHKSGSLTSLIAAYMQKMKSLPQSLSNCSRLETFCLDDCPKLVCLLAGLSSLVSLKHLKLYNCTTLVSLPNDMFHGSSLSSLCELSIQYCSNLVSLPDDMFKGLSSLLTLTIYFCERLEKIPTSVTECTSLEKLQIKDCTSLKHPIPDLSKLQGLVELKIRDVTSSMLEWIPHLPHLRYIEAAVEHEIESRDNSPSTRCLSYLTVFCNDNHHTITPPPHKPNNSLKQLGLFERSKNKQQKMKSLPQKLLQLHLPNLEYLTLTDFEELERLSEWIGILSSLEHLELVYCSKLRHLPAKKHLPQNLKTINIYSCPILKERLSAKEDSGFEWHKISHVPFICIDHEIIQDHRKF